MFRANVHMFLARVSCFNVSFFEFVKIVLCFLVGCEFSVSDADSLVESLLCCIVVPKGLFGVQSSFSTALCVPSGFSDSRFETTPDLNFPKYVKLVLAKR